MKKLLTLSILLTSLTFAAAERPEVRKINAKVAELNSIGTTHCDSLGEYKDMCLNDLKKEIVKQVKKFNSQYISDKIAKANTKVGNEIAEEKCISKYSQALTKEGETPIVGGDCLALQTQFDDYYRAKREAECVVAMSQLFKDNGWDETGLSTCSQYQKEQARLTPEA